MDVIILGIYNLQHSVSCIYSEQIINAYIQCPQKDSPAY